MKKTAPSKTIRKTTDDMLREYSFDYSKARPNRFAARFNKEHRIVILDPDVSKVFTTQQSVNTVLRALIAAMPKIEKHKAAQKQ
jgi:hypothetical protein